MAHHLSGFAGERCRACPSAAQAGVLEEYEAGHRRGLRQHEQHAGHFVQEEEGEALVPIIERFVDARQTPGRG